MGFRDSRRSGCGGRVLIALVIAVISIISYFMKSSVNPVTGEKQHVSITTEQEIALGLQAAPEMARQFGGLEPNAERQAIVDEVGAEVVANSDASKSEYRYEFHLLADDDTINAFALPGGQIFITDALLKKLKTRGALAGVLGHEVAHVVARHSAEHMAKAQLTQGITGAAVIATYDPDNPGSSNKAAMAMMIGQLINLKFSRNDELESDKLGVRFMAQAGYDPRSLLSVMSVLKEASRGGSQPEFFATHPNPENREARIKEAIEELYPDGVPGNLAK